jgi:hypothetical protein
MPKAKILLSYVLGLNSDAHNYQFLHLSYKNNQVLLLVSFMIPNLGAYRGDVTAILQ